jgi:menaquinone-dependent protoporphyrinogen oxidase
MASILLAYASGHGQTANVTDRIAGVLTDRGHDPTVVDLRVDTSPDVTAADGVVVATPINSGRPLSAVSTFVESAVPALSSRPSAYVQLSFASATTQGRVARAATDWATDFAARTGWRPDRVELVAGAVNYTEYGRLERLFFRLFAAVTTGDTDTSRDYEYTDWAALEAFAADFADLVERRHAGAAVGPASGSGGAGGTSGRDPQDGAGSPPGSDPDVSDPVGGPAPESERSTDSGPSLARIAGAAVGVAAAGTGATLPARRRGRPAG